LRRFGDSSDPAVREEVAVALRFKGMTLAQLGMRERALVAYNELFRRFSESTDPELQKVVSSAKGERDKFLGQEAQQG
jgi:hypothetical protein